jgi:UDP-N-acetyl-D-glucosamine dehydrogenase
MEITKRFALPASVTPEVSSVLSNEHGSRVLVVGQGYVGLTLALRASERGFTVEGLETDAWRVAALNGGTPCVDTVSSGRLVRALRSGNYRCSRSGRGTHKFDVAVIAVPTPLLDGEPDLRFVQVAAAEVGRNLRAGGCVVLESTTYPGTTEEIVGPILQQESSLRPGIDFALGYSPERIDPGRSESTLETTPKVVAGINPESAARVREFYERFVNRVVVASSIRDAEFSKLIENCYRQVNVALVNELAMVAHSAGLDIHEALRLAGTKPYGFSLFHPGPGVGGHCIPVDPMYLAWYTRRRSQRALQLVEIADDVNRGMPAYVVDRLWQTMIRRNVLNKRPRILVLGWTYKRNSSDARETPSRLVVQSLLSRGADVSIADPHMDPRQIPEGATAVTYSRLSVSNSDAVLLVVDHDAFDFALLYDEATLVFDCRGVLPPAPHVEYL